MNQNCNTSDAGDGFTSCSVLSQPWSYFTWTQTDLQCVVLNKINQQTESQIVFLRQESQPSSVLDSFCIEPQVSKRVPVRCSTACSGILESFCQTKLCAAFKQYGCLHNNSVANTGDKNQWNNSCRWR